MHSTELKPLAITGIHTDVGKTIVTAVLTQALGCDYWKPVQAGSLNSSDSHQVVALISNHHSMIHPEAFRLNTAASPHMAAQIDAVDITLDALKAPNSKQPLLIETAGGVLSPMTSQHTVADVLAHHGWPTVLVVKHYLGSINHTLSAIESLRSRGIHVLGLMINGEQNDSSEAFITDYAQIDIIGRIPTFTQLSKTHIAETANHVRLHLSAALTPWIRHE